MFQFQALKMGSAEQLLPFQGYATNVSAHLRRLLPPVADHAVCMHTREFERGIRQRAGLWLTCAARSPISLGERKYVVERRRGVGLGLPDDELFDEERDTAMAAAADGGGDGAVATEEEVEEEDAEDEAKQDEQPAPDESQLLTADGTDRQAGLGQSPTAALPVEQAPLAAKHVAGIILSQSFSIDLLNLSSQSVRQKSPLYSHSFTLPCTIPSRWTAFARPRRIPLGRQCRCRRRRRAGCRAQC